MDIWQARYNAIAAGITDPAIIANAELLTEKAISISRATGEPLESVVHSILAIVSGIDKSKPKSTASSISKTT